MASSVWYDAFAAFWQEVLIALLCTRLDAVTKRGLWGDVRFAGQSQGLG